MKTVVFSDIHSDHRNLLAFALKLGVTNDDMEKIPGVRVVSVGDFIHGGSGTRRSDHKVLALAHLFDQIVIGNHDLPHAFPDTFEGFAGMRSTDSPTLETLRTLRRRGVLVPATHANGWLVTHAGLHPDFGYRGSAERIASDLCTDFEERIRSDSPNPVFDAIGAARGGLGRIGGIFWQDWLDFTEWATSPGPNQIVGHTPRLGGYEHHTWTNGSKVAEAYCMDAGAGLSGKLSALVDDGDGVWYPVVYEGSKNRDEP